MPRVDFYGLEHEAPAGAVLQLAHKIRADGQRLLIVSGSEEERRALSASLWDYRPQAFLANGLAGEGHEERQPILLSATAQAANGARMLVLADGTWPDGLENEAGFERVFYLFGAHGKAAARQLWAQLRDSAGLDLHYWKRDGARWVKGP